MTSQKRQRIHQPIELEGLIQTIDWKIRLFEDYYNDCQETSSRSEDNCSSDPDDADSKPMGDPENEDRST